MTDLSRTRSLIYSLAFTLLLSAAATSTANAQSADTRPEAATQPGLDSVTTASAAPGQKRLLLTLDAAFIGLQALDTASTLRALDHGLVEGNPLMSGLTDNPAAFIAMKSATTAGIVLLGRKLSARHPLAGIILMSAIDGATSFVVARNFALTARYVR